MYLYYKLIDVALSPNSICCKYKIHPLQYISRCILHYTIPHNIENLIWTIYPVQHLVYCWNRLHSDSPFHCYTTYLQFWQTLHNIFLVRWLREDRWQKLCLCCQDSWAALNVVAERGILGWKSRSRSDEPGRASKSWQESFVTCRLPSKLPGIDSLCNLSEMTSWHGMPVIISPQIIFKLKNPTKA